MVKAKRVLLANGGLITTDFSCWDSEEVSAVEVKVPDGTKCDICEEVICSEGEPDEL